MSKPTLKDPQVVVVGSVHMDLIANAPRLPRPGESILGSSFAMHPGGKGGNQAIASAQHGASTAIIARVGDDAFGRGLWESLAAKHVDVSLLQADTLESTGTSPVLIGSNGEYASIVVPGASLSLTPAHLVSASLILRDCAVLMLQLEIGLATSAKAARLAGSAGATVILNAAPASQLSNATSWEIWRDVDIVVVNRDEAEVLSRVAVDDATSGVQAAKAVRFLLNVANVIVTLGGAGAVLADDSGEIHVPGYEVTVVDTIGAGDAFVGAVGAAISRDVGLREAVRLANAAGALAVGRKGAYDASPTRAETEVFAATGRT